MIPGQLIAPGQLTDLGGLLCLGARSDACNCSHEFFVAPWATSRGGLAVVQHQVTRLAEVTSLRVNRTQKLLRGKSSLAHAYY